MDTKEYLGGHDMVTTNLNTRRVRGLDLVQNVSGVPGLGNRCKPEESGHERAIGRSVEVGRNPSWRQNGSVEPSTKKRKSLPRHEEPSPKKSEESYSEKGQATHECNMFLEAV